MFANLLIALLSGLILDISTVGVAMYLNYKTVNTIKKREERFKKF